MTYEAVEVSHRSLIDVIEAVCALENRATLEKIAEYSDITKDSAGKALKMAMQLQLVKYEQNLYVPVRPFARLIADAKQNEKKAILKFKLMEHEPFKFFAMLILKGEDPTRAALKTKNVYNITGSTTILKNTFLDLGIFSRVFAETEKGVEAIFDAEPEIRSTFESIDSTLNERTQVENFIASQLDEAVSDYIKDLNKRLITAGIKFSSDPESCIKGTADVFEDFLKKICSDESVDISNATGIIQIGDKLKSAGKITTKHQGFIHFIGQMRNAFKHTRDIEIDGSWKASSDLSLEIFLVTLTAMNSIFLYVKRNECIL